MTFAHPAALWCLLALPAVLAVHFLRRRSRRQVVTTLFLLRQLRHEPQAGHRFQQLRASLPLWMQLLMVLLITWVLAGPRWVKKDAVQRLALVLDASASMSAFRPEAEAAVARLLGSLHPAARAELALLTSDPAQPALYHGGSAAELIAALPGWQPLLGMHDFSPALRAARTLVGSRGGLVLVTDHTSQDAEAHGAARLSVGRETANVGWSGVTVEDVDGQPRWRALLHNRSRTPQTREWRAEAGGPEAASAWQALTLAPGEIHALSGPFPTGADLLLRLQPDAFPLDDLLPLVRPRPKPLSLHLPAPLLADGTAELRALVARLPGLQAAASPAGADLRAIIWPPGVALGAGESAVVFASPPGGERPVWLQGSIVAEAQPLVEGLNWQSLLAAEGMVIPQDGQERVLLWQGARPLISLRRTAQGAQQLFCHFDLVHSNALKLPATAILLHRFLAAVRREKIAPEAANFDTRQRLEVACEARENAPPLELAAPPSATPARVPAVQAHLLRAPAMPGFFTISQGGQELLRGAAAFADAREADLTTAAPQEALSTARPALVEAALEADPLTSLWLLLLTAALLTSWWWSPRDAPVPVDGRSGMRASAPLVKS